MASELFKFDFSKRTTATTVTSKPQQQTTAARPPLKNVSTTSVVNKMEMSQETFNKYRNMIYKLCGIYFTDSKKYLMEGRIARKITEHKMRTFDEYLNFLMSHEGKNELNALFEAITINETYFYRAPQQFDVLENVIIPEMIAKKRGENFPTIKIWISASSSGEEAYTIAIIILEKLKNKYPNVQFQVYASDIDRTVIEQAKSGVYREYAIRNVPKEVLAKYFKYDGANYILSDNVKRIVRFYNINLYDAEQMRQMKQMDVIFCCNVLIYFDIASKQQVVSYLYDALNKGGYLFIGYSESLHGISKAFSLVHLSRAMAYKKE